MLGSMVGPDEPDFGTHQGARSSDLDDVPFCPAPMLFPELMFEVPARSSGSRRDLEHPGGQNRRRTKTNIIVKVRALSALIRANIWLIEHRASPQNCTHDIDILLRPS